MATKAKTAPKPAPVSATAAVQPLAEAFAAAVKLMDGGSHGEAAKAFQSLVEQAQAAGDWPLKRRAQIYLRLAQEKVQPKGAVQVDPASEIQDCLNRRHPEEALKHLEKAVKAQPAKGHLLYLRAVAYAQMENAEAAADSLRKALELDADLVYQWHMEPDFNAVRKSSLFAFTEGR